MIDQTDVASGMIVELILLGLGLIFLAWYYFQEWYYKKYGSEAPDATVNSTAQGPSETRSGASPTAPAPGPANSVPVQPDGIKFYDIGSLLRGDGLTHSLLVGMTKSGKSTLATGFLKQRALGGDKILIIDPHAEPDTWPEGLSVAGAGRDYAAVEQVLQALLTEMDRRFKLRTKGKKNWQPVTIFLDEWPSISRECESAKTFLVTLSCEARKVDMRLVILSQSSRVESLGLKGVGDIRENFSFFHLGSAGVGFLKTNKMPIPNLKYICVLEMLTGIYLLNPYLTPQWSTLQLPENADYVLPISASTETLSNNVITTATSESGVSAGVRGITGQNNASDNTSETPIDDATIIRTMLSTGASKRSILEFLGGNRNKRLAQIQEIESILEMKNEAVANE